MLQKKSPHHRNSRFVCRSCRALAMSSFLDCSLAMSRSSPLISISRPEISSVISFASFWFAESTIGAGFAGADGLSVSVSNQPVLFISRTALASSVVRPSFAHFTGALRFPTNISPFANMMVTPNSSVVSGRASTLMAGNEELRIFPVSWMVKMYSVERTLALSRSSSRRRCSREHGKDSLT